MNTQQMPQTPKPRFKVLELLESAPAPLYAGEVRLYIYRGADLGPLITRAIGKLYVDPSPHNFIIQIVDEEEHVMVGPIAIKTDFEGILNRITAKHRFDQLVEAENHRYETRRIYALWLISRGLS